MPDAYTHGHHESVLRSHRWRTAENSAGYLLAELSEGSSILDVGAGPGTITLDLAARVAPGVVRGVDASADIVAQAEADRTASGAENVTFAVDDAYALASPDDAWDVVHAHQVLQHLTRPVDALREFRRVVKPGGVVAARDVDYEGVIWWPRLPALDEWLEVYLATHRATSGEPAAGRQLKAWANEAGFTHVHSTATLWLFESSEDRDGGAGCGPTGRCSRPSRIRWCAPGSPTVRRWSASVPRGSSGRRIPMGGSRCRTVRSSPGADPHARPRR
jgi:Methylase involved in ubiquinone/menaquinone biosynthesis